MSNFRRRDERGQLVNDALDEAKSWAAMAEREATNPDGSATTAALLFSNASAYALVSIAESLREIAARGSTEGPQPPKEET